MEIPTKFKEALTDINEKRNEILKELIEKVDKLTEAVIRLRKD